MHKMWNWRDPRLPQCKIWHHKNIPLGLRSMFVCLFARHSLIRSCPGLHERISDDNMMPDRNLLNYSLDLTLGSYLARQLCFRAGFIPDPFGTICKYTSGPSSYTCLLQGPWYLHSLPLYIPRQPSLETSSLRSESILSHFPLMPSRLSSARRFQKTEGRVERGGGRGVT